jgi:hypothetical protein
MRLDLSADAANSLFVVCLSNPAYAWNDHTKLMFPNGFIKTSLMPLGPGTFWSRTPDCISAGQ